MLAFLKRHRWPIVAILLFLVLSYLIIGSNYNHVFADAGQYARQAKVLYTKNKIDIIGSGAAVIGQLLFSNIFCHIFGFRLKILHISVYIVDFLFLVAMYLLLYELGINQFLALFGSLTLLINPISIRMIDWYMTEPFFMFYLISSILFFIKGLREEKYIFLYVGSIFSVFAVLTRQHAVSVSISLILLCVIYRKYFKKKTLFHCIISSFIPFIAIGLFYLYVFLHKRSIGLAPSGNIAIIKTLADPFNMIYRLYFDTLFFLHYTVLYLAPLFVILFLTLLIKPKKIKDLSSNFLVAIISILAVVIGTFFLYFKKTRMMPYIPSIFSIGALTKIFKFSVINKNVAHIVLTLFTLIGSIVILIKILEYFHHHLFAKKFFNKNEKIKKHSGIGQEKNQICLGEIFLYFWGIIYMLITILIGLRYDRYILPVSILTIYIVLKHFSWIGEQKKVFIVIFTLIFSVFIFKLASLRLSLDLQWEADYFLMQQGVPAYEINGGLGFNSFYSFDYISDLYKDVKLRRPINWYKFHPLAHFFVNGKAGLEKRHPGLVLYKPFDKRRLFGFLERKCYIYKRKKGYSEAIWL